MNLMGESKKKKKEIQVCNYWRNERTQFLVIIAYKYFIVLILVINDKMIIKKKNLIKFEQKSIL